MVLRTHSVICYPGSGDHSGPYDIDAKGSPDGTKIAFITNYDLKNGPYTKITKDVTGDRIIVRSTDGFPEKGLLVSVTHAIGLTGFHTEVLSYDRKTDTSFEGLTRGFMKRRFQARWQVKPLPHLKRDSSPGISGKSCHYHPEVCVTS